MYGLNVIRKSEQSSTGETLWVQEVFSTIQGEGPLAGMPAVFVRLAGCNLKCHFCDTEFESSTWHPTIPELVLKIKSVCPRTTKLIVLTGGEPLRQNIAPLTVALHGHGYRIQVETAGTLGTPVGAWVDDLIVSPKTRNLNKQMEYTATAIKYILRAGEVDPLDGLPNKSTQILGQDERVWRPWPEGCVSQYSGTPIYIQPCDEGEPGANAKNLAAAVESCLKFGYRLSVQVHKLAGLP